jgi:predicted nucleic acid-binding protein
VIVLDTNVVSELLRPAPAPPVVEWVQNLDDDVAITSIALGEILAGVRRLPRGRRQVALAEAVDAAIAPYRESRSILPFDDIAADHYADILLARERLGRPIHTADAQIAAICLAHGATCATRNTSDFVGTGVAVVDPWSA